MNDDTHMRLSCLTIGCIPSYAYQLTYMYHELSDIKAI